VRQLEPTDNLQTGGAATTAIQAGVTWYADLAEGGRKVSRAILFDVALVAIYDATSLVVEAFLASTCLVLNSLSSGTRNAGYALGVNDARFAVGALDTELGVVQSFAFDALRLTVVWLLARAARHAACRVDGGDVSYAASIANLALSRPGRRVAASWAREAFLGAQIPRAVFTRCTWNAKEALIVSNGAQSLGGHGAIRAQLALG